MINKIISGGQTGADQAALDVAIKFNIPHGGWIPKGRKTEKGPLPEMYQLKETSSADYRERTRKNILDSRGTVLFTRGIPTGGSRLTKTIADQQKRPFCHIDLTRVQDLEAAMTLQSFIMDSGVTTLNVAGSRDSKDPYIYFDVKTIMEALLFLVWEETDLEPDFSIQNFNQEAAFPETIQEAVQIMASGLSLRILVQIARMPWQRISSLYYALLDYTRMRIGLEQGNPALLKACAMASHIPGNWFSPEDAVMEILKDLKLAAERQYQLSVV